jgi:hypothetical protein
MQRHKFALLASPHRIEKRSQIIHDGGAYKIPHKAPQMRTRFP